MESLQRELDQFADSHSIQLRHFQSNHEGALIDCLQEIRHTADGALLNAGGYTHTSVALRDTVLAVKYPVVEIHITNPQLREAYRRTSFIGSAAIATFQGEGVDSYKKGLTFLLDYLAGKVTSSNASATPAVFRVTTQIWLDDTDAAGIIFNAHLFRICHRVYEQWLEQLGFPLGNMLQERQYGFPIVHLEGDFVKPLRTGMNVTIELEVIRVGDRSMTLGYHILDAENVLYATAQTVHVVTNFQGKRAQFPDEFRDALTKYL